MTRNTATDLNSTEDFLNVTNGSLYATTEVAALVLAEVNLSAGVLGFATAANSAGHLASAGEFKSEKGTSDQSVSTTDVHCTNIEVFNNATVDRDLARDSHFWDVKFHATSTTIEILK